MKELDHDLTSDEVADKMIATINQHRPHIKGLILVGISNNDEPNFIAGAMISLDDLCTASTLLVDAGKKMVGLMEE